LPGKYVGMVVYYTDDTLSLKRKNLPDLREATVIVKDVKTLKDIKS
jgi:hypothetical protein